VTSIVIALVPFVIASPPVMPLGSERASRSPTGRPAP
jgi:hypothetical protein